MFKAASLLALLKVGGGLVLIAIAVILGLIALYLVSGALTWLGLNETLADKLLGPAPFDGDEDKCTGYADPAFHGGRARL